MATGKSIECDICGRVKGLTNRWWKVKEMADHIRFFKAEAAVALPFKDVCGQACAHRLADRWMETGSLEKPEVLHGASV